MSEVAASSKSTSDSKEERVQEKMARRGRNVREDPGRDDGEWCVDNKAVESIQK